MNKTNNHSERNRIAQNDRYHFTDDLYYQGKRYGTTGRPVVPAQSGYPGTGVIITTCPVVQIQVQEANLPILYVSVQQLYHHFKL